MDVSRAWGTPRRTSPREFTDWVSLNVQMTFLWAGVGRAHRSWSDFPGGFETEFFASLLPWGWWGFA